MKNLVCLMILAVISINVQAQFDSYEKIKQQYDYHEYVPQQGDPYDPAISGVCSFLIPGLGQMLNDETGRGLSFLAGHAGFGLVSLIGYGTMFNSIWSNDDPSLGIGIFLIGLGGMVTVDICSIVDAVRVAKVKNMYIRDYRKTSSLKLELSPYITQIEINNQITTPIGLSLKMKF